MSETHLHLDLGAGAMIGGSDARGEGAAVGW